MITEALKKFVQQVHVELTDPGPIVLSGDLYHFRVSREKQYVPEFNFDADMTRASIEKIEKFLEINEVLLWIEHESAWFEQMDKAPKYYQ